ncbi:MAG: hypothetical protein Q7S36_00240 [Candidatus Liptonbacteria bacterium]|nr:hypothetical protein [Candidatus Liptonbacteria bacterium]
MDSKKVFRDILLSYLFLILAFACFWTIARNIDRAGNFILVLLVFLGIIFLGMLVNTILGLKSRLIKKPEKPAKIFPAMGEVVQFPKKDKQDEKEK